MKEKIAENKEEKDYELWIDFDKHQQLKSNTPENVRKMKGADNILKGLGKTKWVQKSRMERKIMKYDDKNEMIEDVRSLEKKF